ncbi:MAG: hypothetical protein EBR82_38510 [Caulobacteraceae bacterium]|nr:hypothetical protein [Caulobacteraceae bacterium]
MGRGVARGAIAEGVGGFSDMAQQLKDIRAGGMVPAMLARTLAQTPTSEELSHYLRGMTPNPLTQPDRAHTAAMGQAMGSIPAGMAAGAAAPKAGNALQKMMSDFGRMKKAQNVMPSAPPPAAEILKGPSPDITSDRSFKNGGAVNVPKMAFGGMFNAPKTVTPQSPGQYTGINPMASGLGSMLQQSQARNAETNRMQLARDAQFAGQPAAMQQRRQQLAGLKNTRLDNLAKQMSTYKPPAGANGGLVMEDGNRIQANMIGRSSDNAGVPMMASGGAVRSKNIRRFDNGGMVSAQRTAQTPYEIYDRNTNTYSYTDATGFERWMNGLPLEPINRVPGSPVYMGGPEKQPDDYNAFASSPLVNYVPTGTSEDSNFNEEGLDEDYVGSKQFEIDAAIASMGGQEGFNKYVKEIESKIPEFQNILGNPDYASVVDPYVTSLLFNPMSTSERESAISHNLGAYIDNMRSPSDFDPPAIMNVPEQQSTDSIYSYPATIEEARIAPRIISDAQIKNYVGDILSNQNLSQQQMIDNINQAAGQFGVSREDLAKATGYDLNTVNNFLGYAKGGLARMQAGGLAKVGKSIQRAFKAMPGESAQGTTGMSEVPLVNIELPKIIKASEAYGPHEGKYLNITQTDRTKVGEGFSGGPGFSGIQLYDPAYAEAGWGVKTPGVAQTIVGSNRRYPEGQAIWTTMIGTPEQHRSNQMVFDALYKQFMNANKLGKLTPELKDTINNKLASVVDKEGKNLFPQDVDISNPRKFRKLVDTFDKRAAAADVMGGVGVGGKKGQIFNYDRIIRDTTDPALIDVPTGSLGNRMFQLTGEIVERPELNRAFPMILKGQDLGVMYQPVPRELVMEDYINRVLQEKGRQPGYMDWTRGYAPSQLLTETLLTKMQKAGYKKGGRVKKEAKW